MERNLVTRRYGKLLCLRQGTKDPTDGEWDECLDLLHGRGTSMEEGVGVLVVTDGGGPTPEQRRRLSELVDGKPVLIAVCTESIRTRFVASSVALFSKRIKAFSKSEIGAAYDFLQLDRSQRRQADNFVAEATAMVVGGRI